MYCVRTMYLRVCTPVYHDLLKVLLYFIFNQLISFFYSSYISYLNPYHRTGGHTLACWGHRLYHTIFNEVEKINNNISIFAIIKDY